MLKVVVTMLLVWGACAPTPSSFQPAHIAKNGCLQAEVGSDLSLPMGTYRTVVDTAETDGLGCDWHPNSTTNAKMATLLVAELKARLSW